jgi:uncharacterized protein YjgD (DUF1641 family)
MFENVSDDQKKSVINSLNAAEGNLEKELLARISSHIIFPIKKSADNQDTTNLVAGLKSLATVLSMTDYDRKRIFDDFVDGFQVIDSNIYSLGKDGKMYILYAINNSQFFEGAKNLVASIQDSYVDERDGAGGIGFEVTPKPKESK